MLHQQESSICLSNSCTHTELTDPAQPRPEFGVEQKGFHSGDLFVINQIGSTDISDPSFDVRKGTFRINFYKSEWWMVRHITLNVISLPSRSTPFLFKPVTPLHHTTQDHAHNHKAVVIVGVVDEPGFKDQDKVEI